MKRRKLFSEYGPLFYWISVQKECLRRAVRDFFGRERFAQRREEQSLPVIVKGHTSVLLRQLHGVDMALQQNKARNLALAAPRLDGIVIDPGETFSFWRLLGPLRKRRGYRKGLVIKSGALATEIGGGICQLGNMLHWLVLHSPLTVTEMHHHTDAVFPDAGRHVPFGTGVSLLYNYVDYRFRNDTVQPVQIRLWVDDTHLNGELRSSETFPLRYRIEEEDHHFAREGADYYRNSHIYRRVIDRAANETVGRELILRNHSRVLYDHSLIPAEQIRESQT